MNDERRGEIVYEEGWRENAPVISPEEPVDYSAEELSSKEPLPDSPRRHSLLLTIQLVICLLLALALFLLKMTGNKVYDSFMEFYREELQKPLISRDVFDAADISRLFPGEEITVQVTPDEAEGR